LEGYPNRLFYKPCGRVIFFFLKQGETQQVQDNSMVGGNLEYLLIDIFSLGKAA